MPNFKINKRLLLMKICFFIFDSGTAPITPFLPIIAKQRGIPVFISALIFTILPILNVLVRPLVGYMTDRWRCRKAVFLCASLSTAIVNPILHFIPTLTDKEKLDDVNILTTWKFWLFLLVITLSRVLWMIVDVLQDTICINILGKESSNYGSQRIFGAVGWGFSSLFTGWCIDWYSQGEKEKNFLPAFAISSFLMTIHFLVASNLENKEKKNIVKVEGAILKVMSDIKVVAYLLWTTFAGIFTAFIWYFIFIYIEEISELYHPERKPWLNTIEGFSFLIQCVVGELPIFLMFGFILKIIGHMTAFSISFIMFGVRFYLYSIIKDPVWTLPVELLNGVSFAIAFLSGISYAAKVAPPGCEGTLQGLFGMAFQGLGISVGCFIAGYTFENMGSSKSFRLMSFVAFFVFVVQVLVNKLIQKRKNNNYNRKEELGSVQEMKNLQSI
ncbi:major facilitator superfamily domain-containing protein 6-B-like [Daktulosphaira vitifoliae]|uniref:major facilitator superfamily domain-containing protein 6-B-like n=1 Tax=Daktulosphaira vitifoliae TaxID=58002 RepID=UPI0021AACF80|nr:major facilitator superfamily domain-containing protein 6-B-like [Daktulosphaira vitifoliae]XP_050548848.1 major facilitator superfamily domain-containing protein 6-B-like [Daktulosphaira vitifoliae]XP_050548849.1 major facilitator superfamily domain-containing protein 6-B-like [Daktulosphaira vitifoliae]XP_050548850.1 major facilitator superfamily domain-containing protein 6-B-like [Daktulosphaira vitifoliae]XP_050548851.1 major facilitator superfamily domain-containing protein 6-B-like [Da